MTKDFINKLAQALYLESKDKSKSEVDEVAKRAIEILREKHLLAKQADLFAALEKVRLKEEKKTSAVVQSRNPLTDSERKGIKEYLRKKFKLEAELEEVIDKTILGGFRVQCGDTVYDATLNSNLKQLATHLTTK